MRYSELAEVYKELASNSKTLKKTEILSEFLKKLKKENKEILYLLRGRIFPDYDEREIGISTQLTIKALSKSTGHSDKEIVKRFKFLGDLGKVAEELTKGKRQKTLSSSHLTCEKVIENLRKLTEFTGEGTVEKKISLIAELLTSASPEEALYLTRTILGNLRIGIGEGVLRDAIVWSCFNKEDKEAYISVQEAYDKATDFALVFEQACKGKLKEISLNTEKPVKVMLFQKVKNFEEAFKKVGEPAAFEYKYDGFRMLIHKDKKGVRIFTRRLENVSAQFPDVVEYVRENVKGKSFIIDSEAIGFNPKTKKYQPFQSVSQRIKRKHNIDKLVKELPIEINVFDILYYNGKSLLKEPFKERRKLLEKIIINKKYHLKLAEQIITSNKKEAEAFYHRAVEEGQEGVMAKNLSAPYKPGSRVGYGVKIKPEENDFDLVIVKAEYGTGKRAGWLTSYTVACRDKGRLLEIGKVSTGLKEKEEQGLSFKEMTKKLKPLITGEKGREVEVKPELVVTVTYQNVQKSPTYTSGYALRFPRFTRLRPDRSRDDIATLSEIEKEYEKEK
ncbi:MAG: ATP-dependent DNA ligase [Nanoarchaeota archaeon]